MSRKKCTKCAKSKSIDSFGIKSSKTGQRQPYCKECQRQYAKEHYSKNKKYYIKKARNRNKEVYQQHKQFVDEYKHNLGCKYCPENDPCCLDFHHSKDDKEFSVSSKLADLSLAKIKKEISKCTVVCSNCHRKIHAGKL